MLLHIGDKIEILGKSNNQQRIGNIIDYLYKIRFNEFTGYVWGGLIADEVIIGDFDDNKRGDIFMYKKLYYSFDVPLTLLEYEYNYIIEKVWGDDYDYITRAFWFNEEEKQYHTYDPTDYSPSDSLEKMYEVLQRIKFVEYRNKQTITKYKLLATFINDQNLFSFGEKDFQNDFTINIYTTLSQERDFISIKTESNGVMFFEKFELLCLYNGTTFAEAFQPLPAKAGRLVVAA
jgi:hypothetical protein